MYIGPDVFENGIEINRNTGIYMYCQIVTLAQKVNNSILQTFQERQKHFIFFHFPLMLLL